MRELRRAIDIDAPPEAVWAVLADSASYPEWNPFIVQLNGELRVGARLDVRIKPPGGRAVPLKPTVLAVEPERELRWRGRLLLPGLFDGEHRFQVEPLGDTRARFVQSERFTGILVRPLAKALDRTERGFDEMNAALKARSEGGT